jgi:hypothetical protein
MNMIWKLGLSLIAAFFISACFNPPEYPATPEITFNKIKFIDTPDQGGTLVADTLALSIDFKDGDGDIGFSDADLQLTPATTVYAEHYYFDNTGQRWAIDDPTTLSQSIKQNEITLYKSLLKYSSRKTTPFDTLPAFTKPFNCINWEILYKTVGNAVTPTDTLYFQLNPNHYNIYVDFLVKDPSNGSFSEFDFREEYCSTYDGRLPILSKDIGQETPLEGTIRYAMAGVGFKLIFSGQKSTLKLRVRIQDRALNKSNEIETPEFSLSSIK